MPSPPDQITTIDQLRALPDDDHCHELLDGVHVVTAKQDRQHQSAIRGLLKTLGRQLAGRADYEVMISPSELVLGPRTFVQPDLFVVRQDPDHPIRSWADLTVPLLAVEVLSPDTLHWQQEVITELTKTLGYSFAVEKSAISIPPRF